MVHATVTPAGLRVVKLLVGNPPQSIADLMDATGVTRTAVTEQLNELVAAGFVERRTERVAGRGRPRHLYSATEAAMLVLFAGSQRMMVPAIWRVIEEIGGKKLKSRVLRRVSRSLAEHYNSKIRARKPAQRFLQLIRVFREDEGNLIEIDQGSNGQTVMRRRSCSFFSMFDESRAVCQIDEKMMSLVVGAPVRRTACRHDGDPCCTFEIVGEK